MPPLTVDVSLAQMFAQLTPAQRAQLVADLNSRPGDVETMIAVLDETDPGAKSKWMRYGIGAGVGVVAGFLVARALRR